MLLRESFVLEFGAVDGFAACSVSSREVSALDHELLDDTVEAGALEVQRLARLAQALLASREAAEVLSRLGNKVAIELHGDTTRGPTADCNVKEDAGTGLRDGVAVAGVGGHLEGFELEDLFDSGCMLKLKAKEDRARS